MRYLWGVPEIRHYIDAQGQDPFAKWFDGLHARAAAKVTAAVTRLGQGNNSGVSSAGKGVLEREIDWGPGYRVYFGRDGTDLIILLGGGSKKGQQSDIDRAHELWEEYRKRKTQERKAAEARAKRKE
jgi:putative addiction module killer protein